MPVQKNTLACNITKEEWDFTNNVNVNGVLFCQREELKAMMKQDLVSWEGRDGFRGSIVNMASIGGFLAAHGAITYVAGKHAVLGISRTAGTYPLLLTIHPLSFLLTETLYIYSTRPRPRRHQGQLGLPGPRGDGTARPHERRRSHEPRRRRGLCALDNAEAPWQAGGDCGCGGVFGKSDGELCYGCVVDCGWWV